MSRIRSWFFLLSVLSGALLSSGRDASATPLLVTNFYFNSVDLYELSEASIALVQPGFIASGSAGLNLPSKILVEGDRIFVSSGRSNGKVLVYDLNGQPVAGPGGLGVYANPGNPAFAPNGLAYRNGLLYVADQGGSDVYIFDGNQATPIGSVSGNPATSPLVNPSGIEFDTEGNLWIATFHAEFAPSEIFRWDGANLDLVVSQATAGAVGIFGAAGLATRGDFAAGQGVIQVAALLANGVGFFSETGAPTPPANLQLPFPIPPDASFNFTNAPSDLIFDGDDLLITFMGPSAPGEQTPDGTPIFPLGGMLRRKPDGTLITLAYPMMPASSFALLESEEVPEPTTLALGMAGLVVVGCWCWRRRRLAKC